MTEINLSRRFKNDLLKIITSITNIFNELVKTITSNVN